MLAVECVQVHACVPDGVLMGGANNVHQGALPDCAEPPMPWVGPGKSPPCLPTACLQRRTCARALALIMISWLAGGPQLETAAIGPQNPGPRLSDSIPGVAAGKPTLTSGLFLEDSSLWGAWSSAMPASFCFGLAVAAWGAERPQQVRNRYPQVPCAQAATLELGRLRAARNRPLLWGRAGLFPTRCHRSQVTAGLVPICTRPCSTA